MRTEVSSSCPSSVSVGRPLVHVTGHRDYIWRSSPTPRPRMLPKLDRYTWHARILPVYLTAAPAVLAISATLRLERRPWASWGGYPATRLLRHDHNEFNATTRKQILVQTRNGVFHGVHHAE